MVEDLGGWTIYGFVGLLLRLPALSLVRADSPRGPVRFHFAVSEGAFLTRAGRGHGDGCHGRNIRSATVIGIVFQEFPLAGPVF